MSKPGPLCLSRRDLGCDVAVTQETPLPAQPGLRPLCTRTTSQKDGQRHRGYLVWGQPGPSAATPGKGPLGPAESAVQQPLASLWDPMPKTS